MDRHARETWLPVAIWSTRIAVFGVVITGYGVILHRYAMIETPTAFALLCAGLSICFISLCMGVYAMIATWVRIVRGFRYGVIGVILSLIVLGPAAYYVAPGVLLPAIHDITTDLSQPPTFTAAPLTRPRWANDFDRGGPDSEEAAAQRAAYPEVAPLDLEMQTDEAFDLALRAAQQLGWEVVATFEPTRPGTPGQIEAIDRTLIMQFADDVAIRVTSLDSRARFDVRSVSRFGKSDLGSNAARIRETLAVIEELADQ